MRPLTLRFLSATVHALLSETRSQGQKPAHKDLGRNGQSPAITSKAAYAPVSKRPCSRS
ncbi:alpha-galactosidase [Lacticaseibacillus rhamnosus]|nr:alpha-galactosidase [Lacticaseibacillus rhamnosus]